MANLSVWLVVIAVMISGCNSIQTGKTKELTSFKDCSENPREDEDCDCVEYERQEALDEANNRVNSAAREWKEYICNGENDTRCSYVYDEYQKALKLRYELDYGKCIKSTPKQE